jgi:hypothetical protein
MKRWNTRVDGKADVDPEMEAPRVDRFLAEITWVCRRYGLSIAHEDCQGGFIVEEFTEETNKWLHSADINLDPGDLV